MAATSCVAAMQDGRRRWVWVSSTIAYKSSLGWGLEVLVRARIASISETDCSDRGPVVLAEIGDGLEIRGDRFGGALDPSFERIPVFGRNG